MDYIKFDKEVKNLVSCYRKLGAEVDDCIISPPVTEDKVYEVEKKLGVILPSQLKKFFLEYSGSLQVSAFFSDDFCESLPDDLDGLFCACFEISLDEIERAETSRKEWISSVFSNEDDEYDSVWYNKLGIMTVANGDVIALDVKQNAGNPSVVYLRHDGDDSHGVVLGKDFESFISNFVRVGGCGNEDWQILPFVTDEEVGIDSECENAKEFRGLIGFDVD